MTVEERRAIREALALSRTAWRCSYIGLPLVCPACSQGHWGEETLPFMVARATLPDGREAFHYGCPDCGAQVFEDDIEDLYECVPGHVACWN